MGELEKNSFIVLPGTRGYHGLMPSKLCVPAQQGRGREKSYSQGAGLLIRIRVLTGPAFLQRRDYLVSSGFVMGFCGS